MKKRRWNNILLTLILAAVTVLLPVAAMAAGYEYEPTGKEFTTESGFNCKELQGGTVLISGYTHEEVEDLIIPEVVYDGDKPYKVTVIGQSAFHDKSKINGSLTLPKTLKIIEVDAFSFCSGLKGDLTIPDSVEYIDEDAFYNCGFNGELKLGSGLKEIGAGAFLGCHFTGRLEIPSSVYYIGNAAFYTCSGFTGDLSLTGNNMIIGGNDAIQDMDLWDLGVFYGCSGLSGTLTIGDGVTYIDEHAFYNMPDITRVVNNSDQEIDLLMLANIAGEIDDNDSPWTDEATGKRITRIVKGIAVKDKPIESVEVTVTAPSAGTVITATEDPTYPKFNGYDPDTQDPYPEASIPDDVPYRLMGEYLLYGYWFDDVFPEPFDSSNISFYVNDKTHPEVEAGEKLLAEIWLDPTSGRYFTDETKVTVKGGTLIARELKGYGAMTVYILVTAEEEVPDTGDAGNSAPWIMLAAVSACGLAFLRRKNRFD